MNVLQRTEKFEADDASRPNCPKCGLGMWLFASVPHVVEREMKERRTYVCEVCGTMEAVVV